MALLNKFASDSHFADNFRIQRTKDLVNLSLDTHKVFKIPQFAFVREVKFELIDVYNTATVIIIGFTGNKESADDDAFFKAGDIVEDAAGFVSSHKALGVNRGGKWFSAAPGAITISVSTNLGSNTRSRLWVDYSIIY